MEEYLIYDEVNAEFSVPSSTSALRDAASEALMDVKEGDLAQAKCITYSLCAISRSIDELTEVLKNKS